MYFIAKLLNRQSAHQYKERYGERNLRLRRDSNERWDNDKYQYVEIVSTNGDVLSNILPLFRIPQGIVLWRGAVRTGEKRQPVQLRADIDTREHCRDQRCDLFKSAS